MKSPDFYRKIGKNRFLARHCLLVDEISDVVKTEFSRYEVAEDYPAFVYDANTDRVKSVQGSECMVVLRPMNDEAMDRAFVKLLEISCDQFFDEAFSNVDKFPNDLKIVKLEMELVFSEPVTFAIMSPKTFLRLFANESFNESGVDETDNKVGEYKGITLLVSDLVPPDRVFLTFPPDCTGVLATKKFVVSGMALPMGGQGVHVIRIES